MTTVAIRPKRIAHVSLRVRNLERSVDFYRGLFGLEPHQTDPPSAVARICSLPANDTLAQASVLLTEGLPLGSELSGLDHFSFVVSTEEEVNEAYRQAVARRARATQPRMYGGHYQTFVFDPDGYKIEIRATD